MDKLLQFEKVQASHNKGRSVRPVTNRVRSMIVYTQEAAKNEPSYYWLLPHILCVVVNGASVYIDLGEQK
jgi:hypothetical protein